MISLAVWVIGLVLIALILVRSFAGRTTSKYPFFYLYLTFVLLKSSALLFVYLMRNTRYAQSYWYLELVSAALGCALVWDILRETFMRFPGAGRIARNALLLVLTFVLSKAIADTWTDPGWWLKEGVLKLERDLRAVQAGALLTLLAVIASYRIPLGRNLWGMISGYGLFISTNVIILALRSFLGAKFQGTWSYFQPISYVVVLCLWCVTLWRYAPAPAVPSDSKLERDYHRLVAATAHGFLQARSYLNRTIRP